MIVECNVLSFFSVLCCGIVRLRWAFCCILLVFVYYVFGVLYVSTRALVQYSDVGEVYVHVHFGKNFIGLCV